MIELRELNSHGYVTTPEIDANLLILLDRMNIIRLEWGRPMIVTSGLRSKEDQERLIKDGISRATRSHHLTGAACDVLDRTGALNQWLKARPDLLKDADLYLEERQGPWQHFQIFAPLSGKRWFLP